MAGTLETENAVEQRALKMCGQFMGEMPETVA